MLLGIWGKPFAAGGNRQPVPNRSQRIGQWFARAAVHDHIAGGH